MVRRTSFFATLSLVLASGQAMAQNEPLVDIAASPNLMNQVEIRLRPDGPFDELVSSIVFSLRWNDADGANLGTIVQTLPQGQYCPVGKSGPEHVSGGFRYQVFSGLSFITLADLETAWAAGEEILLCSVNVINGSSSFTIAEDAFIGTVNGGYYISLNGAPRTGVVYSTSTGIGTAGQVGPRMTVEPNPTTGTAWLVLENAEATVLQYELLDAAGRVVLRDRETMIAPMHRTAIDLSGYAKGAYLLKASDGNNSYNERILLR